MPAGFVLLIIPSEEGLDADDPIFLDQVGLLRRQLLEAEVEVVPQPALGGKGAEIAAPIIEALVTGGSGLTVIGLTVREWMKRRGTRAVRLVVKSGAKEISYDITAKNVTDDTFLASMKEILDGAEKP